MNVSTCLPLCVLFGSFCAPTLWAQVVFQRLWKHGVMCLTPMPQCVGVVNVYYSEEEAPAKCGYYPFDGVSCDRPDEPEYLTCRSCGVRAKPYAGQEGWFTYPCDCYEEGVCQ
jgi:hypothetical protein